MRQEIRGFGDYEHPSYYENSSQLGGRWCECCEKVKAIEEFSTASFSHEKDRCNKCSPHRGQYDDDE